MTKPESKEAVAPASGQMLRTDAAARYCGLSESTMAKMRVLGTGPEYIKIGGKIVVYDVAVMNAWLNTNRRKSTSVAA